MKALISAYNDLLQRGGMSMDKAIISIAYKFDGWGMALYVLIVTLIAGALSTCIGIEREAKGQAAGLRTHVLLSVGCALMMALSVWAIGLAQGYDTSNWDIDRGLLNYDTSRVAAGIIAGIGFLSAGTIIKNGASVKGLTTAATLWICTGIGMACGVGFILEAIVVTAVALLFLFGLEFVEKWLYKRSPSVHIVVDKNVPILKEINEVAQSNWLVVKNIRTMKIKEEDGSDAVDIKVYFAFNSRQENVNDFIDSFKDKPAVHRIYSNYLEAQKDD